LGVFIFKEYLRIIRVFVKVFNVEELSINIDIFYSFPFHCRDTTHAIYSELLSNNNKPTVRWNN